MLEQRKIVLEIEKVIFQLGLDENNLADILGHDAIIILTGPLDLTTKIPVGTEGCRLWIR